MGDFGSEPRWRDLGDSRDLAAAVRSTYQPLTDSQAAPSLPPAAVALDEPPARIVPDQPAYVPPPLTTDPLAALRESVSTRRRRPTLSGRSVLAAATAAGLLLIALGAGLPAVLGGVEPTESVEPFAESQEPPATDADDKADAVTDTPAWTYAPPAETTQSSEPTLVEPTTGPAASTPTSVPVARRSPAPKRSAAAGTTTTTSPSSAQSPPPTSPTNTTSAPTTAPPPQEPPPEDEEVPEGGGW